MTPLRRIAFPLGLAWARLTRRGERVVLVTLGIAAGAGLLAGVLAGSLVAQDRSVERATARMAAADRTVRLVWGGIASGPGTNVDALDRTARREFGPLADSPTRAMLFRTTQANGHLFDLGAIDGLARYVHVRAGRLPRTCRAERCEVVQLGGGGPIPRIPGLRLMRVGRATLDSPIPFGNLITRETYASVLSSALLYHTAATPPLLLASGVKGLATAEVFAPSYRSYTWTAPIDPADVHPWTIDAFSRAVTRARSELASKSLAFDLTAPIAGLRSAEESGRVAARRLLLIGGEAAALLLAFAALAATGLRRDAEAQWRRLTWYGDRRWQLVLGSAADAAAVGAAFAVVFALARGAADAGALADERGTGAVLLLLPALIAFVAAVLFARVLAPSLRLLERWGRSGPVALRLAALSLARNPGRAAVAVAFLVVSLGLALFAQAYRATLTRGQHDQAEFAVPVDAIVREDLTKLVPVLRVAPVDRFRSLSSDVRAIPVVRLPGNVRRLETSRGFPLLGLPAHALTALSWRGDYSSLSQDELARRLRPAGPVAPNGVRLPAEGKRLELPLRARGDELAVRAIVVANDGTASGIPLGTTSSSRLAGPIPGDARGGRIVSVTFDLTGTGLHGVPNAGINAAPVARGTMSLGRPRVDGRRLPLPFAAWTGTDGITAEGRTLRYLVTTDNVARFRARQPTDAGPIPVVVSPGLAAAAGPGGILPLDVGKGTIVSRVAGTVRRMPTVEGDAVLVDGPTIATALDADAPGGGATNEIWLESPKNSESRLESALRRPPFVALATAFRRNVLEELRSEPLARGTLITLAGAALTALVLALVGLLLGVVSDLRDERGDLFDLEAQGAAPGTLRGHLQLRSMLVAVFGILGGLATGAVLAALIVALVTLTASAGSAEPPLMLGFNWPVVLLGLFLYGAAAAILVGVATRRAFRHDVAGRFAEVGT